MMTSPHWSPKLPSSRIVGVILKPLTDRYARLSGLLLFAALAFPAQSQVTQFKIVSRELVTPSSTARFGPSEPAQKLVASALLELDPGDQRNAVIVDVDRAIRNSH